MRHSWLAKFGVLRLNQLVSGTYNTFFNLLYTGMPGASTLYFMSRIYAYGMPRIRQLVKLSLVYVSSSVYFSHSTRVDEGRAEIFSR